jgi:hypothetical protein
VEAILKKPCHGIIYNSIVDRASLPKVNPCFNCIGLMFDEVSLSACNESLGNGVTTVPFLEVWPFVSAQSRQKVFKPAFHGHAAHRFIPSHAQQHVVT